MNVPAEMYHQSMFHTEWEQLSLCLNV